MTDGLIVRIDGGGVAPGVARKRATIVEADIHEGIENTIIVLGHKLKQTTIKVVRDYDRTLPLMTVHGSELNQVWTNLIDNAIDALGETGTLTIKTGWDGPCALVTITDDGRIKASLPTLNQLRSAGAKVIVLAHLGRPKGQVNPKYSLAPAAKRLSELLGVEVGPRPGPTQGDDLVGAAQVQ